MLARNPNLVVIARASAFSFKGKNKDIKSIAAKLNVANVLEGSVFRDENQLHVMARLVDANANSSMWSQTYDLDANDTHLLHNEIAKSVASVLRVEQPENVPVAASQPEALRHYLMGRHFHGRRAPGDLERAIRAVQICRGNRSRVHQCVGRTGWIALDVCRGAALRLDCHSRRNKVCPGQGFGTGPQ